MVCLDESDRAFDMGFEPQISAILSAVRPDRQMVMFSATFPKAVENLAKKALRSPLEIIVGGRSVASDSVDQYAEVVEEEECWVICELIKQIKKMRGWDSLNKLRIITFYTGIIICSYFKRFLFILMYTICFPISSSLTGFYWVLITSLNACSASGKGHP